MHPPPGVWEPWFLSDFPVGEGRRGAGIEPQKNPPSHHGRWGELELTVVAADRSRAMSSPSAKQDLSRKASAGGSFSQALSSALNYPHREAEESIASLLYHGDYNVLWESPQRLLGLPQDQTWVEPQIAPLVGRASVTLEDFREYMASMSELVSRFESMHPMGAAESMAGGEEERARGAAHAWNSQHALAKEELKKVPSFYFEKRFHLEDNDTFQRTGAAGDADECAALQDELSNYLDVVEQNLMREIQARSSAFYSALNTLQDLYAEVDKTMETIVEFRRTMQALDKRLVGHALRIAQLRRHRKNVEELHRKLSILADVKQTQQNLQVLLSCSDFVSALDLICDAKMLISTELAGVTAVRDTSAQLEEMEAVVQNMMCSELAALAMGRDGLVADSSQACGELSVVKVSSSEEGGGGEEEMDPASLSDVEDRLLAISLALVRVGKLNDALEEYKEAAVKEVLAGIKGVLRREMPAGDEEEVRGGAAAAAGSKAPLAERLRALHPDTFLTLMKRMYKVLHLILSRCANVHGLLAAVIRAQEEDGRLSKVTQGPTSPEACGRLLLASQAVLDHICDTGHQRCWRLIAVREQQTIHGTLAQFSSLFDSTVEFVASTEKVCGTSHRKHVLRAGLHAQAKSFLEVLHEGNTGKLNALLDQERWVQVDVPVEIQAMVYACTRPGGGSWKEGMKLGVQVKGEAGPAKHISLDCEKFFAVGVVTALIKMIADYISCIAQLPALGLDIVQRLLDLLKLYNVRSCQLVLGARAMHLAGLKTITAKHLALSAQSVSFLAALLPHLKDSLVAILPERQHVLLGELDKVGKDLTAHEEEIYVKLVSIMRERLDFHCRNLMEEAWNDSAKEGASSYMRGLVKEMQALIRVLVGTLDKKVVQRIMKQLLVMTSKRLVEHFAKLPLSTSVSQHRLAGDVSFLKSNLKAVDGVVVSDADLDALTAFCDALPAFA